MKCGLLGQRLGHSYSPAIHQMLGDYSYVLFEKEPSEISDFLKNGDFSGLNVTIPYKKSILPHLDNLTDTARRLGAVNIVVRQENGKLLGHNSDYFGFRSLLEHNALNLGGKKVLVLGSGGASNTAVAVLEEQGASPVVISRQGKNNYENLRLHADASFVVNATPVGMYPHCGQSPIDLGCFPRLEGVADMIYNPARTALLLDAEQRGLKAVNGLWMLVAQAKESAEFFTGNSIPDETIEKIHNILRRRQENIVLIGMPGCGKSTIGALLAQKTGRIFVDTDLEIEKTAKKSIPTIFAEDGEGVFREMETAALSQFGKMSGLVIATGGGCVTKSENWAFLRQNGEIFWLQRPLSALETEGRPLSVDLEAMAQRRFPLYRRFADHIIENSGLPENTVAKILEVSE